MKRFETKIEEKKKKNNNARLQHPALLGEKEYFEKYYQDTEGLKVQKLRCKIPGDVTKGEISCNRILPCWKAKNNDDVHCNKKS